MNKAKLSILFCGHLWYNFANATVVQGFSALGHTVYGINGFHNYCEPWEKQPFDLVIRAWDREDPVPHHDKPVVYVCGEDYPPNTDPCDHIPFDKIRADAYFVRDFRGSDRVNVFPMNFGVEERYYSATRFGVTPLKDRHYDVVFFGRKNTSPVRAALLSEIERKLTAQNYVVRFEENIFQTPDATWSKWVSGYCVHDALYYKTLADSKIILSPHGAGTDCGRTWEAFASGGIPLIQKMNTQLVPPGLRHGLDCLFFETADEAVELVIETLRDKNQAQILADQAFQATGPAHSTKARAEYMLDKIKGFGLL